MAGHEDAGFSALYRATLTPLRQFLRRLLGSTDDAADLAHEAYARVYKAMGAKPVESPKAFLFTTARNLALSQIRRGRRSPIGGVDCGKVIEFTPSETPGVEHIVMARQDRARLDAAIAGLPPGCRQVLIMCKLEQRTHAEISTALGIAISTVEKQHARALRLLRAALSREKETTVAPAARDADEAAGE